MRQEDLRGEVAASAEPPPGRGGLLSGRDLLLDLEVAVVEVHRRHVRVAGVDDAGDAAREERHHLA